MTVMLAHYLCFSPCDTFWVFWVFVLALVLAILFAFVGFFIIPVASAL